MQCVHPLKIVKNRVNHAGIVTGVDSYTVPCGRCISCRLNYANSWSTRIVSEAKDWKFASFVTLTYNDNSIPIGEKGYPTLVKKDIQDLFKRVRKDIKCRYFVGGEYGNLGRPHYHLCVFSNYSAITNLDFWQKHWTLGFVYVGTLTRNSANYVAKYCVKKLGGKLSQKYTNMGITPEFALMSRRPGIGFNYLQRYGQLVKNNGFVVVDGKKQPIPKYFGAKLFSDEEKQKRFEEQTFQLVNDILDDINFGRGYDFHHQKEKQIETNIKSRLNLKKNKL